MTEHEVPTHVQAEDRVVLWFTFPQIVAMTAVCALGYGLYRYVPVGPSEVRVGFAVLFALFGIAMIVGKVGGRRLPVVVADLLRFGLGPRRYVGLPAELVRSEPPAPPVVARTVSSTRKGSIARRRRAWLRRRLRRTFRPHGWFGKRRRRRRRDRPTFRRTDSPATGRNLPGAIRPGRLFGAFASRVAAARSIRVRRRWLLAAGVAALSAAALAAMSLTAPPPASGQEPEPEFEDIGLWDLESEIDFEPRDPVPGRRVFYEELRVVGDRAHVTLRAATGIELRVRAFGGLWGRELRYWSAAALDERGTVSYSLPLAGDEPSFTFSWKDGIGQGGGVTVRSEQIPHPLPEIEGELCDLEVTSLGWTPGLVKGAIESECVTRLDEVVKVWTVVGHDLIGVDAVIESTVTEITGILTVTDGGFSLAVPFVPDGETEFGLPVAIGEVVRHVEIEVELEATLRIPMPDMVRLTHHPAWIEERTETVRLWRPGTGRTVTRTVTLTGEDGSTSTHTISAYLSVSGATVTRNVTLRIDHEEHVRAEVESQEPIERTREETLSLSAHLGADAPFRVMVYPRPEPAVPPADQRPVSAEQMKDLFGWR